MNINDFNYSMLDDLKHCPAIILTSARAGGKSFLLQSLMKYLDGNKKIGSFSHIFAFSQTDKYTGQLSFMRQEHIFDDLDNLQEIVQTRIESDTPQKELSNICLIFNDIYGMRENGKLVKNSDSLGYLFSLCRHRNCTVIALVQRNTMLSPLIRMNADITFIWTPKSTNEKIKIKEEYLGLAKNKKETDILFESIFNGTPYQCMVVLSYKQGVTKIDEYCYKFVAPEQKKWKSKSLKQNGKPRIKKQKKLLKNSKKNNVFSIYNIDEIKTNKIRSKINTIRAKKRYDPHQLPT